mgnify:CR=1 FL=1
MDAQLRQYLAAGTVTVSRLLVNNYRKIGLSETELVLFLQLQEQFQFGQQEVDTDKIAQNMEIPSEKVFTLLYGMVEKKLFTIAPVEDAEGKKEEREFLALPRLRHWFMAAAILIAVTFVTPVIAGLI